MPTLTVSKAKPHLGKLLDSVSKGQTVYIRRKERLYRLEEVQVVEPIPVRAEGFFNFDSDSTTSLADKAPTSTAADLED